jgi:hypothetical protein
VEKPKNMKLPVTGSVSLTQQPYRLKGDERLKIKFFSVLALFGIDRTECICKQAVFANFQ